MKIPNIVASGRGGQEVKHFKWGALISQKY